MLIMLLGMWQMLALTVSLAYFTYDTLCCLVELPFSFEMLIHHALTLLGLAYGYLTQIVSASHRWLVVRG